MTPAEESALGSSEAMVISKALVAKQEGAAVQRAGLEGGHVRMERSGAGLSAYKGR